MAPASAQDVAVLIPLVLGLLAIVLTVGIHAAALGATARFVRSQYKFGRAGAGFWADLAIVAGVMMLALVAHMASIAIWAALFVACGEFTALAPAFYHSAMNYTTLGYGDVVMSPSSRLFGPLEAADGLLMFGLSTAMIFAVIERLFRTRSEGARKAPTHH